MVDRLDPLAQLYESAGIEAWTVWTPDFDSAAITALERRGHVVDAQPAAMALELERWQAPELGDLDWDMKGSAAVAGPLNDLAYGLEMDGMAPAIQTMPERVRQYQARVDGQVVCVLGTIDHPIQAPQQRRGSAPPPTDLGIYFVATHSDHRGRGLARGLMTAALSDGRERGLRTSSLQASKAGEPIYLRFGYESYFRLVMYERLVG